MKLKQVIANMKRNKAPGPDNVTAEQLNILNSENVQTILELINRWWNTGTIDEELELANIISIFQKKETPLKSQTIDPLLYSRFSTRHTRP